LHGICKGKPGNIEKVLYQVAKTYKGSKCFDRLSIEDDIDVGQDLFE